MKKGWISKNNIIKTYQPFNSSSLEILLYEGNLGNDVLEMGILCFSEHKGIIKAYLPTYWIKTITFNKQWYVDSYKKGMVLYIVQVIMAMRWLLVIIIIVVLYFMNKITHLQKYQFIIILT